jgi:hypothetical protein
MRLAVNGRILFLGLGFVSTGIQILRSEWKDLHNNSLFIRTGQGVRGCACWNRKATEYGYDLPELWSSSKIGIETRQLSRIGKTGESKKE